MRWSPRFAGEDSLELIQAVDHEPSRSGGRPPIPLEKMPRYTLFAAMRRDRVDGRPDSPLLQGPKDKWSLKRIDLDQGIGE